MMVMTTVWCQQEGLTLFIKLFEPSGQSKECRDSQQLQQTGGASSLQRSSAHDQRSEEVLVVFLFSGFVIFRKSQELWSRWVDSTLITCHLDRRHSDFFHYFLYYSGTSCTFCTLSSNFYNFFLKILFCLCNVCVLLMWEESRLYWWRTQWVQHFGRDPPHVKPLQTGPKWI